MGIFGEEEKKYDHKTTCNAMLKQSPKYLSK
jgi:hypothetical protein